MGQIIYFDICAEIIMLVTILTILVRKKVGGRRNISFMLVSLVVFFTILFDILSVMGETYHLIWPCAVR